MFKVRDVLDRLPGTALVPLSREKGLAISGRVEDFRAGLAKHYGRRMDELLGDLRRSDLSKLFRRPFEVDGVTYRLRNRSRFAKADLLDMALTLLGRGEIHEQFSIENLGVVDEGDEEGDDEGDDTSGDEEEPEEAADEAEDEEPAAEEIPEAVQDLKNWLHLDQWSTARPLKRVLKRVYDQEFTRLRAARFQRLVADLYRYGVEFCLDADASSTPVTVDDASPGLDVLVRLRLRAEEQEAEEPEEQDAAEPEGEADGSVDPDALPVPLRHLLAAIADGEWSRPRTVSRLLVVLYDQEFARLRAERFHRLLRDLDAASIEACFADDPDQTPLALDADSPGLEAPLRLRRRPTDARYAATIAMPMFTNPPAPSAALPPVQVVPDPGGRISQVPAARMTPYELALLRLEFLTAAPSVDRARDPQWPDAFLDAAGRGVDLDDRSRRFLRLAANTFVSGSHDPMVRVSRLTRALHPNDWPMLLLDYERLNPDADPEFVNEVLRHTAESREPPAGARRPALRDARAPPAGALGGRAAPARRVVGPQDAARRPDPHARR